MKLCVCFCQIINPISCGTRKNCMRNAQTNETWLKNCFERIGLKTTRRLYQIHQSTYLQKAKTKTKKNNLAVNKLFVLGIKNSNSIELFSIAALPLMIVVRSALHSTDMADHKSHILYYCFACRLHLDLVRWCVWARALVHRFDGNQTTQKEYTHWMDNAKISMRLTALYRIKSRMILIRDFSIVCTFMYFIYILNVLFSDINGCLCEF